MGFFTSLIQTISGLCCCGGNEGKNQNSVTPVSGIIAEKQTGIQDMPDLVTKKICDYLEFEDIIALRKTSFGFRNFLTTKTSDSLKITSLTIVISDMKKELRFNHNIDITYMPMKKGTLVRQDDITSLKGPDEGIKRALNGVYYEDAFYEDLSIVLLNSDGITVIDTLCIVFDTRESDENYRNPSIQALFILFERCLRQRRRPLRVITLRLNVWNQNQILQILPYLDPEYLETFEILNPNILLNYDPTRFAVDKLFELDTFKNLEEIQVQRQIGNEDLRKFMIFPDAQVWVDRVLFADLDAMLMHYTNSPTFKFIRITYEHRLDWTPIRDLYGDYRDTFELHPSLQLSIDWYFEMPEDYDHVIKLQVYFLDSAVGFRKMSRYDVPEQATIHMVV